MKEISAGGVVYRKTDSGVSIQLIWDRFGKVTLPKGKMETGETPEETALREIAEETGIEGRIAEKLGTVSYRYLHPEIGSIDKEVHYFLVEAVKGDTKVQEEEIAGVQWLSPQEAWSLQKAHGYENNDEILEQALKKLENGVSP